MTRVLISCDKPLLNAPQPGSLQPQMPRSCNCLIYAHAAPTPRHSLLADYIRKRQMSFSNRLHPHPRLQMWGLSWPRPGWQVCVRGDWLRWLTPCWPPCRPPPTTSSSLPTSLLARKHMEATQGLPLWPHMSLPAPVQLPQLEQQLLQQRTAQSQMPPHLACGSHPRPLHLCRCSWHCAAGDQAGSRHSWHLRTAAWCL